jgi:DNA-binding NtrC family response regulator
MEPDTQRQLAAIIKKSLSGKITDRSRIILICKDHPRQEDVHNRLLPSLYALVANQHFRLSPLREHRRDIPRLVQYYLERYSVQYGKIVNKIDDHTLGMFINYDWPGNLTEINNVLLTENFLLLSRRGRKLSMRQDFLIVRLSRQAPFSFPALSFI